MKIGILSDTHGLLRPEVFSHLKGVEHILHAGDVGDAEILVALEVVAPVTAVWGNTDGFPIRHRLNESEELELGGITIALTHGHTLGSLTPSRLAERFPDADMVVYGHTHRPREDRVEDQLILNPGSCGPRRFDLPVSMATVEIDSSGISVSFQTLL
ncbi:MAG: metallophosphoesterase [Gemmatimonadales bacterium]|nr:MAG: metallophosphoesterase [Gemmatimonadales bacterium]